LAATYKGPIDALLIIVLSIIDTYYWFEYWSPQRLPGRSKHTHTERERDTHT